MISDSGDESMNIRTICLPNFENPVGAIGRAGAYGGCLSWAVFEWETRPS